MWNLDPLSRIAGAELSDGNGKVLPGVGILEVTDCSCTLLVPMANLKERIPDVNDTSAVALRNGRGHGEPS